MHVLIPQSFTRKKTQMDKTILKQNTIFYTEANIYCENSCSVYTYLESNISGLDLLFCIPSNTYPKQKWPSVESYSKPPD